MALTEGMVRSLLAEMAKYLYAADMAFDRRNGQSFGRGNGRDPVQREWCTLALWLLAVAWRVVPPYCSLHDGLQDLKSRSEELEENLTRTWRELAAALFTTTRQVRHELSLPLAWLPEPMLWTLSLRQFLSRCQGDDQAAG